MNKTTNQTEIKTHKPRDSMRLQETHIGRPKRVKITPKTPRISQPASAKSRRRKSRIRWG